jgi:hypothetical protein
VNIDAAYHVVVYWCGVVIDNSRRRTFDVRIFVNQRQFQQHLMAFFVVNNLNRTGDAWNPITWTLASQIKKAGQKLLALDQYRYLRGRFADRRNPFFSRLYYALSADEDERQIRTATRTPNLHIDDVDGSADSDFYRDFVVCNTEAKSMLMKQQRFVRNVTTDNCSILIPNLHKQSTR